MTPSGGPVGPDGGHPIRLGGFRVSEAAIAAVVDTLRSGWPGPGARVDAFEAAFAELVGRPHAVAVSSGTAALHLAVRLLGLAPGTEVITTPITFIATNQVLLDERLTPVFADVDPTSGNIDLGSVAERLGPRTGAIMVVHLGGNPIDLDALDALAGRAGVPVIHDCAHAVGASFAGHPIGHRPGLHAFSFQTTKNLPLVDGGMLLTDTAADAARARRLRWMGIDRSTHERAAAGYRWHYDVTEAGHRYTMSDLNAALGLAQIPELPAHQARRAAIAARYDAAFAAGPLAPVTRHPAARCSWYLYVARSPDRDAVIEHLARVGIEAGVHYRRNDRYPMFRPADLPGAAEYERTALSLPMHLGLSDRDVDRVIAAVRDVTEVTAAASRSVPPGADPATG